MRIGTSIVLAILVLILFRMALRNNIPLQVSAPATPQEAASPAPSAKTPGQIYREADYLAHIFVTWDKAKSFDESLSGGSGFIIKFNGKQLLLTNRHVVQIEKLKLKTILVRFKDEEYFTAKIDKLCPELDLAVLKLEDGEEFKGKLADPGLDADPEIGDQVFSLGSPYGLQFSFGTGFIMNTSDSNTENSLGMTMNTIAHSAPIGPGSSGGPLVDTRGRVIGINFQDIAGSQVGFASRMTEILAWLANNY